MTFRARCIGLVVTLTHASPVLVWPSPVLAGVHAVFDPDSPSGEPFPSALVHRRFGLLGFSANGIHEEIPDEQV